ncbi:MAG: hypothetical protein ABR591_07280 [Candidatus Velthaea sp.]
MNYRFVAIASLMAILRVGVAAGAQPLPVASPSAVPSAPPPAGVIPSEMVLDVTGVPLANAAFLDAQIRRALDRRIRPALRPGASIAFGPIVPWPLLPLPFGDRAAVNVTVTIAGDNTSTAVTGMTSVTLNSVAVPAPAPDMLFLSDDPEYVQTEGLIFRGDVAPARASRLYYYHSDLGVPRDLDVALTANVPSRVHLIHSEAGPDLDVMSAGHKVSRDFLLFQRDDAGIVVDILPGAPFIVRHALLLQSEVVAGTVDVHVLSGGTVGVSVVGSAAGSRPEQYLRGPRVAYDGHRRHGTFDLASYGSMAQTYTVGGPPAAVQYGARAPTPRNIDASDDGHDYGDYGVVHRLTMTLVNPTDDPHVVYLYEKPLGGPARGSFLIDGQLRELGCVRLSQPYWLATYQLAPHSTGSSTTLTMPDGGSFYPVEFGATDVQPLPYTPPVGSADGCSPNTPAFPDSTR